jgi:hypothetical protein
MTRPAIQPKTHDVTQLLHAWGQGEGAALEQMVPIVYHELKRIAHRYMAGERHSHTLQLSAGVRTALVEDARSTLECGSSSYRLACPGSCARAV